jgi:hypothetical protein
MCDKTQKKMITSGRRPCGVTFLTTCGVIFFNKFDFFLTNFFNKCSTLVFQQPMVLLSCASVVTGLLNEQAKLSQHGSLETSPILPWEHNPPILP